MEYKDYRISIDGREKQITSEEDVATILRIFNKDTAEDLTLKEVGDICAGEINFYIASYQRGYRWGKDEVRALLDDIYEVYEQGDKAPKYCLQPLVVKKRNDAVYTKKLVESKLGEPDGSSKDGEICGECYELLDGQQRLTTLWLILKTLSDGSRSEPMYSVCYELVREVDENFIKEAERTIKCWLGCHEEFNAKAKKYKSKRDEKYLDWIEDKIRNYKETILGNLCFIWYEVKNERRYETEQSSEEERSSAHGQSEKLFRKINKGKIELTNAELFKAMLLNDENARTDDDRRELERISFEWDKMEQSLRNDDFWYFVSNDVSEERTRIDYILEVYARGEDKEEFDVTKDRYSFLVVQKKLKDEAKGIDGIKKVWEDIVSVHDKLYSWYQDDELYHNIGFLVACEGKRRSAAAEIIVDIYMKTKNKDKDDVKSYVKGKIRTVFAEIAKHIEGRGKEEKDYLSGFDVDKITYEIDKKDLRAFLLYSNIYPTIKVIREREAELRSGSGKNKGMANETHIERFPFEKYYRIDWDVEHINPQTPSTETDAAKEEIDAVSNLVLLDSATNRGYHNAPFGAKRQEIIERDKKGKYILPQTKRVFLKYNNPDPTWVEWTKQDQEAYMQELAEMIGYVQDKQQEV